MGYDRVLAAGGTVGKGGMCRLVYRCLKERGGGMSSHLPICDGVYVAIRQQAGDWSSPEAEGDAPRQIRERIFYALF